MNRIKIAVTGGPSGGKTTLIETLHKELGQLCAVVPEAASILYRGGFPRVKDAKGKICAQKAIFYTQKELENLVWHESSSPLLVCDRGSLDGIAYWPENDEHFFQDLNTQREIELQRYDWVIHLDTAATEFYDSTNPIRTESHSEALILNEKIKQAWAGHPRRVTISQKADFISKMMTALAVIRAIMALKKMEDIQKIYLDE
ncbi:MAG: ATP-binding protein [Pseudobdellovibrionaceae bacterium]